MSALLLEGLMIAGMWGKPRSVLTGSITRPTGNDGNPMRINGYDTTPHGILKGRCLMG